MARKAMKRIRLTDASANRFRPKGSEYTVWDLKTPGLGVRVKPSGYRVWVYHGNASGRQRRHSLGSVNLNSVEDMRRKCLELQLNEKDGKAPGGPVETTLPVFRDFVAGGWKTARYDRMKPSTRKGVDNVLKTQRLPEFGTLPLDRIARSRVNRWFDGYSRSSPGGANHALGILSSILNHAITCGHLTINPARGIWKNQGRKMTRFLSRKEIRRLYTVLDDCLAECPANVPKADIVRLLLLTGCRRGEILKLRWREVTEDVLELEDSKTGSRTVFLSPEAKAVIGRQPSLGSPWVFPSPLDRQRHRSEWSISDFWRMTRKWAGFEDVRLHDLRHSIASQAVLMGVPLPVVARLLGYSQVNMTLRYAHAAEKEVEEAAERVGCLIAEMCDFSGL